MSPQQPGRAWQKISCLCGADVRVDLMSTDRRVICPTCSNTFDFVVTMDSERKNSRLSLILPKGALNTPSQTLADFPAPAPAPPPPAPAPRAMTRVTKKVPAKAPRGLSGTCDCGESFSLVDDGELMSIQSCPACARSYYVVFKLEPGTHAKTAMLVLYKQPPSKGAKKSKGSTLKSGPCSCGRGTVTRKTVAKGTRVCEKCGGLRSR